MRETSRQLKLIYFSLAQFIIVETSYHRLVLLAKEASKDALNKITGRKIISRRIFFGLTYALKKGKT